MRINSKNKTKDKSYNKKYRENWERIFGNAKKAAKLVRYNGPIEYEGLVDLVTNIIEPSGRYIIKLEREGEQYPEKREE